MPTVRVPDGRLVNFPDEMPREEIRGIIEARFPGTYETLPAPPRKSTFGEELLRGFRTSGQALRTTAEAGLGAIRGDQEAQRRAALEGIDRAAAMAEDYGTPPGLAPVLEAKERGGLPAAIAEGVEQTPRAVASQISPFLTGLGGLRLGASLMPVPQLKPLTGVAGAAVAVTPQLLGFDIQRQAEQQIEEGVAPEDVEIDFDTALNAAVLQGGIESVGQAFILGKSVIRRLVGGNKGTAFGAGARKRVEDAARQSLSGATARGVGRGALAEMPVEVAQQVIERQQAGADILSDDALAEYGEAAFLAATVGGTLGGVSGLAGRSAAGAELQQRDLERQVAEAPPATIAPEVSEEVVTEATPAPETTTEEQATAAAGTVAEDLAAGRDNVIPSTAEGLKTWGKSNFGIGPTARVLRPDGPLAGKDLTDPAQAAEVREILTAYRDASKSSTIPGRIDTYLDREVFKQPVADTQAQPEAQPATQPDDVVVEGTTEEVVEPVAADTAPVTPAAQETPATPTPAPTPARDTTTATTVTEDTAAPVTPTPEQATAPDAQVDSNIDSTASEEQIVTSETVETDAERAAREDRESQQRTEAAFAELYPNVGSSETTIQEQQNAAFDAFNKRQTTELKPTVSIADQALAQIGESDSTLVETREDTVADEDTAVDEDAETEVEEDVTEEQPIARAAETNLEEETLEDKQIMKALGYDEYDLKTPAYKGKALNTELANLARRGNFKQLLTRLAPSQSPEIKRVIRKISSLGLTTKIVVESMPSGKSGSYNPTTNTITLDPETGLTEHAFLHEAVHAAVSQVLNDRNNPLTNQFFNFYSDLYTNIDGFYGGQDLQEFAAELISNPEFQAYLKEYKTPKSQSMWQKLMDAIARFFGFRKQQSAYDKGVKFVNDLLDVSQDVKPTLSDTLFLGTPDESLEALNTLSNTGPTLSATKRNALVGGLQKLFDSNEGISVGRNALRTLRLQDMIKMFGEKIPQLQPLQDAILKRQATTEKFITKTQEKYRAYSKLAKEAPDLVAEMGDIGMQATLEELDLVNVDPEFDATKLSAEKKKIYNQLIRRLNRLAKKDKRVVDMYADMRKTYRDAFENYRKFVISNAQTEDTKAELRKLFDQNKPLPGYIPSVRFGNFFVEFTDASGVRNVSSFDSADERSRAIANAGDNISDVKVFNKTEQTVGGQDFPPSTFVAQLAAKMPTPETRRQVQDTFLSLYPDQSIMQRLRKRGGIPGGSKDLVQVYGDTMVKWGRKLSNLEYLPEINKQLTAIDNVRSTGLEDAVRKEVVGTRAGFIRNPTYNRLTSFFTTGAYNLFLTGNVSAAIVNISAVPLLALPMLSGPFGFTRANASVLRAMGTANPFRGAKWETSAKYKKLADYLDSFNQRKHTYQKEILEGARQSTQDFDATSARFMDFVSRPFSLAEEYARGVTAVAAYDLAMQKRPPGKKYQNMTQEQAALRYALDTVMNVNTSGMAAEGPSLMQHPVGRVMATFKSFIWNSAAVTALAMKQAGLLRPIGFAADPDAEIRAMARRQVIGIYGMSAALAGANGLPFFGAAATLANMINAVVGDDDEPFNAKEEFRLFAGDLVYKGPLNYATNLEISNRVGLANGLVFREDPYSVEQNGYVMTALMQAMGPLGSYALGLERNAGTYLEKGQYGRFLEAMSPSAVRNILKTGRFIEEGARSVDGSPIDTDISTYNLFMQSLGFTPGDLSNTYEMRAAAKNFENKVLARKQRIMDKYFLGKHPDTFNPEVIREAQRELMELIRDFPGIADADTLERSYKSRLRNYNAKKETKGFRFDEKIDNPFILNFPEP